ncbi:hypothetical protein THOM_2388 [Trachipleistophora hominis]|uniref:Uncharacterized protein n=1 Tax=Trachipleistophora hominis TaxID=72359 RepID=L7JTP7_TRAHO|nr:hypothetical protein THOM_2388 [Trachipleistophora hominis]
MILYFRILKFLAEAYPKEDTYVIRTSNEKLVFIACKIIVLLFK